MENMLYILEIGACLIGAFYFLNQMVEAIHEKLDERKKKRH